MTTTTNPTKPTDDVNELLALVEILARQLPKRQLAIALAAWKAALKVVRGE